MRFVLMGPDKHSYVRKIRSSPKYLKILCFLYFKLSFSARSRA